MVINALRWHSHDSHLSVEEALQLIAKIEPEKAYLTHMSHEVGLHAEAERLLPNRVYFAYDGLKVEI